MVARYSDLINLFINNRSKIIIPSNTIIFFDKEEIFNQINNSFWKMSNFKKLKTSQKKLKKRDIAFYYLTYDELNNIDKYQFKFNNDSPKFNELYFKLDDYNENIIKYYTYDNFIRYSEDYNYDFFVYLFTYFGLKSMRWSYTNAHNNNKQNDTNSNIGIRDQKSEFQYSTNETSDKSIGIEGCKNFENIGSHYYFDCCERRTLWYSYSRIDIDDIVKKLLYKSKRYSYKYYENNESLQIRLDNRLRGAKQICYEICNNTHHKIIISKMIKISNNFANIGIKLNSTNVDTKSYTKKYSVNFWDIRDMELITLEDILSNYTNCNSKIDIYRVNSRYEELSMNGIVTLDRQLEIITDKIRIQKLKSNRLSKRNLETIENGIPYKNKFLNNFDSFEI